MRSGTRENPMLVIYGFGVKCVFIGYPEGVKGWKFFNPKIRKVIVSERADFDERYTFGGVLLNGPDGNAQEEGNTYEPGSLFGLNKDDEDKDDAPPAVEENPQPQPAVEEDLQPILGKGNADLEQPEQPEENRNPEEPKVEELHVDNELDLGNNDRQSATPIPLSDDEVDDRPIAIRRPRRNVQPPEEWWKVKRPTPDSRDEGQEEEANMAGGVEPTTWAEAMRSPDAEQWKQACLEEMNAHVENGIWTLTELPPGEKATGCKWVFRVKRNADGSIDRFKARLVAKEYNQRPGFDYDETFAHTMRYASLRVVLALAAIDNLHLRSVDISYAFLNGDVDCTVYISQPEGFKQGKLVCKLNKSIYGLKQSPRLWSEKLAEVMQLLGFKKTYSDPLLYIYDRDGIKVIVPVFVDDITLASKCIEALDKFVGELGTHFKLRDLGPTSYLFGIRIERDPAERRIYLSQTQYIVNKLEEFGMTDCKPVGTPILPGLKLSSSQSPQTVEEKAVMENIPYWLSSVPGNHDPIRYCLCSQCLGTV
ncbi:putative encoded by [Lyophyllum shimeji]|uniref:Encoded by n=1 Tax=Lyophyllum shimeji TaxID=47721 RepID=A0A9P3PYJ0_LYOSH|nr:putative encoded by [Lyophyllum shimeji]